MKIISAPSNKTGHLLIVETIAEMQKSGYTVGICDGKLFIDFPATLLENTREEEIQKMSELSAELNILCQELGISFVDGQPLKRAAPSRPDIGDAFIPDISSLGHFSCVHWPDQVQPWEFLRHKGNPTDNETWQPTRIRKGYGHNKLKGKKTK